MCARRCCRSPPSFRLLFLVIPSFPSASCGLGGRHAAPLPLRCPVERRDEVQHQTVKGPALSCEGGRVGGDSPQRRCIPAAGSVCPVSPPVCVPHSLTPCVYVCAVNRGGIDQRDVLSKTKIGEYLGELGSTAESRRFHQVSPSSFSLPPSTPCQIPVCVCVCGRWRISACVCVPRQCPASFRPF